MRRGSDKVEPVDADLCFERSTSAVTASSETPLVFATAAKERCKLFRRGGAANSCVVDGDNPEVVLDPTDAGIEEAIKRLERKSFIQDGLIPEVQKLLAVPAVQAKEAYLAALSQYSLVMMLVLASLLGAALNPLRVEDYPDSSMSAIAAFNMMAMVICCACLCGTMTFVLEAIIVEGTPAYRIHSIIAQADGIFHYGIMCGVALALNGTVPLIILRAWIGGFDRTHSSILTAICGCIYLMMFFLYFRHLQRHWPVEAQRWTKLFMPPLYKREKCSAAIDDLVAELRYLRQPRDKTLTPAQLGMCLNRYFRSLHAAQSAGGIGGGGGAWREGHLVLSPGEVRAPEERGGEKKQEPPFCGVIHSMEVLVLADQAAFLALVEAEAGGRLAPTMQRLAKQTFQKVVEAALGMFADEAADEAVKHQGAPEFS